MTLCVYCDIIVNVREIGPQGRKVGLSMAVKKEDLRIGSVMRDLNGNEHTVIRFEEGFIVSTYGKGENWLVPSHLQYETLVRQREDFEQFIRDQYPNAIMAEWSDTKWGKEQQFYRNADALEPYTCIEKGGQLVILKEF